MVGDSRIRKPSRPSGPNQMRATRLSYCPAVKAVIGGNAVRVPNSTGGLQPSPVFRRRCIRSRFCQAFSTNRIKSISLTRPTRHAYSGLSSGAHSPESESRERDNVPMRCKSPQSYCNAIFSTSASSKLVKSNKYSIKDNKQLNNTKIFLFGINSIRELSARNVLPLHLDF